MSALVREPQGPVGAQVHSLPDNAVCTSIIVAAEMRYGLVKRASRRLCDAAEEVLARISVLSFDIPADARYAELRVNLERVGRLIGNNDLLIAAHTLSLDCTLVTDNIREFSRIEGLKLENWLR